MLNKKALAASVSAPPAEYVEDVASVYLYTGNGSTQTITNNVDLSGEGGLVWIKSRSAATDHQLFDTERGATKELISNSTAAAATDSDTLTAFNADGFSLGADSNTNTNAATYASFTFRKAPKFFDVVTYTGNATNRTIAHNLGSVPGMIIIKCTNDNENWIVYHRGLNGGTNPQNYYVKLNLTDAESAVSSVWNDTAPTSTEFTLGTASGANGTGKNYVAYLFAHDAGGFGDAGTDNIISCGSFTTDGSGSATVSLGYEPQFLLIKSSSASGNWEIVDAIRGFSELGYSRLFPNLADAESTGSAGYFITSTGLRLPFLTASTTYIYMAIRRPMKVPTSGTEVFSPTVYTGTNADNRLVNTGILTDMVMIKERNDTVAGMRVGDRLRGNPYLTTGTTAAEVNDADSLDTPTSGDGTAFSAMNGVGVGNDATSKVNIDTTSNNHIAWAFKRARGFFDVVCYTGTGSATTFSHNLGAVPELMIVKSRSAAVSWGVYTAPTGATNRLLLNSDTDPAATTAFWNDTAPTSSVFTVGTSSLTNSSGGTYVAYLFATLDGVSKVGSYTGNGSNQTINCGFSAGARFVLIKRTDSTGDWCVFDTARGIVSGNDPFAQLNVAAGEVTGEDAVDPDNSGFIVNETTEALNTNNATYIYLAIA